MILSTFPQSSKKRQFPTFSILCISQHRFPKLTKINRPNRNVFSLLQRSLFPPSIHLPILFSYIGDPFRHLIEYVDESIDRIESQRKKIFDVDPFRDPIVNFLFGQITIPR